MHRLVILAGMMLGPLQTACLEPQVGDEVPVQGLVLPAGTELKSIYEYEDLSAQVAEHDGVEDLIPMLSGFAGGQRVRFWDLGEAPKNAAPIFKLYRGNLAVEDEWEFASPVNIIDSLPGDSNYTPFWSIFLFKVTDKYNDEVIASFAAIEEAIELGLLEPEPTQANAYSNCPVVHRDVRMMVGLDASGDDADGGEDGLLAPTPIYYQGKMAAYFDFSRAPIHGRRALVDGTNDVPVSHQFVLGRPGEPPLSEIRRGVDITGDGDVFDSNDIFPDEIGTDTYTPLRRSWKLTVTDEAYSSIDTASDETMATFQSSADLFSNESPLVAIPANVLAYEDESRPLRNMPMQSERGGL